MKPGTVFYKMTGSGNDFLMFDGRYSQVADFSPEAIRELCDRRHGAGADGVALLDPVAPEGAHFTFHFWNNDGSLAPMCGNGSLCATRLATLIELAPNDGEVRFATGAGLHIGFVADGRPTVRLPDCHPPRPLNDVTLAGGEQAPHLMVPSVPHVVVVADDVAQVDLPTRGPILRSEPEVGPGGANVNWVSCRQGGEFDMRTYERGVEAETLACGTGAVACAVVLEGMGLAKSPSRIWTASGRPLDVQWRRRGDMVTSISLCGEGRLVYRGVVGELVSS